MGYGHLRAAHALARALGVAVTRVDEAPWALPWEQSLWRRSRGVYEGLSRFSQRAPWQGAWPARRALDTLTAITPLAGNELPVLPCWPTRGLGWMLRRGFGAGLAAQLRESGRPLVTTFFAPALAADHHARAGDPPVFCVVTDVEVARVWAPARPESSRVTYLVPSHRTRDRLLAYGVPPEWVHTTGFPLPDELIGGPDQPTLRANLAARLVRLDPGGSFRTRFTRELDDQLGPLPPGDGSPPHLVFAVGGAGAQAELAAPLLDGLRPLLAAGQLRLTLVAGVRTELAARFGAWVQERGLEGGSVAVLADPDLGGYLERFHSLLASADVLWTKPSELTFYAALGLPLMLAPPIGAHEHFNRRWALDHHAAMDAGPLSRAAETWRHALESGRLAEIAWSGFRHLRATGLYRILAVIRGATLAPHKPPT